MVNISNLSSIPFILNYRGQYTLHEDDKVFVIPPKESIQIKVKTIDLVEKIDMNFEMLNAIIGKDKYLKFSKILNIR